MIRSNKIDIYESKLFNGTEGDFYSDIFDKKIHVEAKKLEETYTRKCIEHYLGMSDEMINKLVKYTADYVLALIDDYGEDFYPDEEFDFDETKPCGRVLDWVEPVVLSVIPDRFLSLEELTPTFRLTLKFTPIADEEIEWAVKDGEIVYVGEAANVTPWEKASFKKGWNFAE